MPVQRSAAHFDIDPSLILQLGDDLISSSAQALLELVKNCYDADSEYSKIDVNTSPDAVFDNTFFPKAQGFIAISDNGIGMSESDIRDGWLVISRSGKRILKKLDKQTARGRTPLGDKGLGRLGAQRLGWNIEIFTRPKGEQDGFHVGWTWHDFLDKAKLSEVPILWRALPGRRQRGTTIVISDIREPEQWEPQSHGSLKVALSQLISPYEEVRDFEVLCTCNGIDLDLARISNKVRNAAVLRYRLDFDGRELHSKGRARLDFLRPSVTNDASLFERLVEKDGGQKFFEFLKTQKGFDGFRMSKSSSTTWFIEFQRHDSLDSVDKVQRELSDDGKRNPVSPGPFRAEIDSFDLGAAASARQSTFDQSGTYREYIKELSGVRIYRDGFGIRADKDWLGLGKQWTVAGSYYGLKSENTLGFVALSARDNATLIETTDREGFKDTAAYRNFLLLFQTFRDFAHDAQEFLKRGWVAFKNANQAARVALPPSASPEDVSQALSIGLQAVSKNASTLNITKVALARTKVKADEALTQVLKQAKTDTRLANQITRAKSGLTKELGEAEKTIDQLSKDLANVATLQHMNAMLNDKLETLREQIQYGVEAMSLGITAEVLSHEIANIVDQLADRTKSIAAHIKSVSSTDSRILNYLEYVRSTTNGLRRQLGHLAPSLKYARTRRENLDLGAFLSDLRDYHISRWDKEMLSIRLMTSQSFVVRINRGKLTQVLDNLILNSEYWLKETLAAGKISRGTITISISEPFIRLSDDGIGIDPLVEETLFEPFVTRKKGGRGLGLYVAQQLLESEACSLRLMPTRNEHGRLFRFELDMTGCLPNA